MVYSAAAASRLWLSQRWIPVSAVTAVTAVTTAATTTTTNLWIGNSASTTTVQSNGSSSNSSGNYRNVVSSASDETTATTTTTTKPAAVASAASVVADDNEPRRISSRSSSKNRLVFLGTGSSTGCPMPRCPMIYDAGPASSAEISEYQRLLKDKCHVSTLAGKIGDPRFNPNYRNNPSMVISYEANDADNTSTIQKNAVIDAGKTFREAALRWFPVRGIQSLDAVILTHEHADASFGMDDLRGFQKFTLESLEEEGEKKDHHDDHHKSRNGGGGHRRHPAQVPVPIYMSQQCLNDLSKRFTWLFPNHQQEPQQQPPQPKEEDTRFTKAALCCNGEEHEGGKDLKSPKQPPPIVVERHVASLDVTVFQPFQSFRVGGSGGSLEVIPLPVMHGEDFVSFGFAFTVGNTNVVYLSDISRMLPETMDFIQTKLPQTDILVVDSLHPYKNHPVHYSMKQAIKLAQEIKPTRQTLLVGMNCDSFLPHDEQNQALIAQAHTGIHVQLAHDGLEIEC